MKYIVLEMQTNADGTVGTLLTSYDKLNEAESKFFSILSAAALSTLPVHTAMLLTNNGTMLRVETFSHEVE